MYKIKTFNKISPLGLNLFGEKYDISPDHEAPEAIVVRSAKVNTDEFPGVLAVGRAGAGYNNVSVEAASAKGVCVFNTPGANANAVSELVFSTLGMAVRNIHKSLTYSATLKDMTDDAEINKLVEGEKSNFKGFEISGKTMTVVGLGKIGVTVANAAVARGMKVIGYEPFPAMANIHMLHSDVTLVEDLKAAVSTSDVVSIHVPLLDATKGLVNRDLISGMKDSAILVNFSRGPVVDTDSVVAALDADKLALYVNDFPSNALLNNPKAICTPHLGASSNEAEENCATMAVAQLKDYIEYGIVKNSVNFPAVSGKPGATVKSRIIVINTDVPNMIAEITKVVGESENIHAFKNESNGKFGYNVIDIGNEVSDELVSKLEAVENVVKVRLIRFF